MANLQKIVTHEAEDQAPWYKQTRVIITVDYDPETSAVALIKVETEERKFLFVDEVKTFSPISASVDITDFMTENFSGFNDYVNEINWEEIYAEEVAP